MTRDDEQAIEVTEQDPHVQAAIDRVVYEKFEDAADFARLLEAMQRHAERHGFCFAKLRGDTWGFRSTATHDAGTNLGSLVNTVDEFVERYLELIATRKEDV